MITGRWGKPNEPLLDLTVDEEGNVAGIANPGRQNAPIRIGKFDASTGQVRLEGEHAKTGEPPIPFLIEGRLDGRTLRLSYTFGERTGDIEVVRVEEYVPPALTLGQRIMPHLADALRWLTSRKRPKREDNARKLRERGESLDALVFREAMLTDVPALAELHVVTWNATYNTMNGPTVATRTWQWAQILANPLHGEFILLIEDPNGRLIGFSRAHRTSDGGEWEGTLNKIYLRWEYHGLGLGRKMMGHVARWFLKKGVKSFILFSERSNPTIGFYDRLGGERLITEQGQFHGGYGWRDMEKLSKDCPV